MSAASIASLPSTKPGLQGCNFNPSKTNCITLLFPPAPLNRSESNPYLSIYAHVRSHNIVAKTKPTP